MEFEKKKGFGAEIAFIGELICSYRKFISRIMRRCRKTKEESIEPGTETLSLKADAREDGLIKARTGADTVDKTYQDWYKSVYVPEVTAEAQG